MRSESRLQSDWKIFIINFLIFEIIVNKTNTKNIKPAKVNVVHLTYTE